MMYERSKMIRSSYYSRLVATMSMTGKQCCCSCTRVYTVQSYYAMHTTLARVCIQYAYYAYYSRRVCIHHKYYSTTTVATL